MKNGPHALHQRRGESGAASFDLIAIQALTFLGADPDRAELFLAVSGLSAGSLRQAAEDPAFLNGVMDYLVSDEPLLVAFAQAAGIAPEAIVGAHEARQPR